TLEELLGSLSQAGWLVPSRSPLALPDGAGRALFVGHNTVLVAGRTARVLIDPWIRPAGESDFPGFSPLQPAEIGPVDAIAITHSHGDHFPVGSRPAFARATPLLVTSRAQ